MKVKIESTTKIVALVIGGQDVLARIWQGETESGIPVQCFIISESYPKIDELMVEFERELETHGEPATDSRVDSAPHDSLTAANPVMTHTRRALIRARCAIREADDAALIAITAPQTPGSYGDFAADDVLHWLADAANELGYVVTPLTSPPAGGHSLGAAVEASERAQEQAQERVSILEQRLKTLHGNMEEMRYRDDQENWAKLLGRAEKAEAERDELRRLSGNRNAEHAADLRAALDMRGSKE